MDILFSPVCFRQADSLYGRETSRLSSGATLSPGSQRLRGLPAAIRVKESGSMSRMRGLLLSS